MFNKTLITSAPFLSGYRQIKRILRQKGNDVILQTISAIFALNVIQ